MNRLDPRNQRIAKNTACVTAVSVFATFSLSYSMRMALEISFDWFSWIECVVIPLFIAGPIGWYVFNQAENLRAALENLERSHAELNRTHKRLAFVSQHDQMTGLLNREGFLRRLEDRQRLEGDAVLLIVDADHFKKINDRHGHHAGDDALRKIAKALLYAVRRQDIVGRIGGEEFAILLVSTSIDEAIEMAEIVRRQVQTIPWKWGDAEQQDLTVSIGGAALTRRCAKVEDQLREADRCLYEAKRLGRNRVSFGWTMSAVA